MRYIYLIENRFKPLQNNLNFEENQDVIIGQLSKISQFIQKNCQPWLQESQGKIVYRGIRKNLNNFALVKEVRQDRKPKDSDMLDQDLWNRIIKTSEKTANRTNSIFVTSDLAWAKKFFAKGGDKRFSTCAVFPIGDFNYTWNPKWKDWADSYHAGSFISDSVGNRKKFLSDYIGTKNFTKKDFAKHRWHDMEYVDLFNKFMLKRRLKPNERIEAIVFKKTIEEVAKKLRGDDGTLPKAIDSGNEIMIHCDKILLVPFVFVPSIKSLLNRGKIWNRTLISLRKVIDK